MKASTALLENYRAFGGLLKGVFAAVDGGRLPCADYIDRNLQNAFYEGYKQSVEVTNLFVWSLFGEIIHTGIKFPGSCHDNNLAYASGLVFPKLSDMMIPLGYAILGDRGDSAFLNDTRITNGNMIRGRKTNETRDIPLSCRCCYKRVMASSLLNGVYEQLRGHSGD